MPLNDPSFEPIVFCILTPDDAGTAGPVIIFLCILDHRCCIYLSETLYYTLFEYILGTFEEENHKLEVKAKQGQSSQAYEAASFHKRSAYSSSLFFRSNGTQ